ncbi:hypothetical protein GWO43_02350 [candidate division KSB1 bacterium]|nr:hypothetical protein [candidate division KSB1 bacterium]NIR69706.1 hypothetical protein [candidate division KSB1 bacterium]NIS24902.1 hypothetical protein [candidate division KSB1 bacterium]NIT69751.1 hypothetical protein [candidate division KSB1 bacterium]NIU23421.1 hypothetical protein [candidate division KSB1 bacterium]
MKAFQLRFNGFSHSGGRLNVLIFGALFVIMPTIGTLVFYTDKLLLLGGIMGVALIAFSMVKPEAATLVVVFVLYTNLAVVAKMFHGVPDILAGSFSLLLAVPLTNYLFIRRQKIIIDYVCLLMVLFLAISVASSFFAKDKSIAFQWVGNYILEGLAIYFLFINVVRNLTVLKKVIWVLLIAGAFMGSLSLYQELFNAYSNTFGGIAQRSKDVEFEDEFYGDIYGKGTFFKKREKMRGANRTGGPIGKANRFGQIMLVLAPLALFRYWGEHKWCLKYFAAAAAVLILCGVLLTYSRGAFVTMVVMTMLLLFFKYVRLRQVLISLVVLVVLMSFAAPGYLNRIDTIRGVQGLVSSSAEVRPDGTTRGRLTEMLAAFLAFTDYPILGVGPGQYTPYYSKEYQSDPDIAFRYLGRKRRAHILYFEMAAETGILGIGTFMAIAFLILFRLWKIRRISFKLQPEFANIATSLWFAVIAYLGTAVFLHLAYQRYYWFIVSIAGAAIQIYYNEVAVQKKQKSEDGRETKEVEFEDVKPALNDHSVS